MAATYYNSDMVMSHLDINEKPDPLLLGVFMVVYMLSIIACIILVNNTIIKPGFGRERPTRIKSVYRYCNMRDIEHGKAMASGDSACCYLFCSIYWVVFGWNFKMMVVPLVCLGRVYVHCHWIGDTIAGVLIGIIVSYFTFSKEYFPTMA